MTRPLCPPLSSRPLDNRQRKAATSASIAEYPTWSRRFQDAGLDSKHQPISPQPAAGRLKRAMGDPMHTVQVLTLLLALSGALNVAFTAGLTARLAGAGPAQAILTGPAPRAPSWRSSSPLYPPTANHDDCPSEVLHLPALVALRPLCTTELAPRQ